MNELSERDLRHIWHPCTQMKDHEDFPPIVISRAQGVWLYDVEGNRYLDAVSSWWVNLFGHANKRLSAVLADQATKLEHVIFAGFSHEPAIELAERITKLAPTGLERVFFADNGSSSIEVALKMSFQYHQQTEHPKKTKFVTLSDAYHGETLGALALGDLDLYSKIYKPILMDTIRVQGPDCYRCPFGKVRDTCASECYTEMETVLHKNHDKIAAVIIEPMIQAAAGMKMYSPEYLKKLRTTCSNLNIILIADEIAVGFGRTGNMFACEHASISPDIMCLSKGLTAGYMPLSLTLCTDKIYQAFYSDYSKMKAFMHSHSYTGNPLACRIACESLKIFKEDKILQNNMAKSKMIGAVTKKFADRVKQIGEIRQLGMVLAIELVKDNTTKEPFPLSERIGYKIYKRALKKGVLIRPLGNVIYFIPPYIINDEEITFMVENAFQSIEEEFK